MVGILQLLDVSGKETNQSPTLKAAGCISGLQGAKAMYSDK
jgi:hypothetical protein